MRASGPSDALSARAPGMQREWSPPTRARARIGDGPAFLSLDVDFVDAAFCPGTGTPEVGGPSSFQALSYLRALAGMSFVGFDVVEVSPPYDGPGQVTALFAANVIFEMLSLVTLTRKAMATG
jgi:agmatinase